MSMYTLKIVVLLCLVFQLADSLNFLRRKTIKIDRIYGKCKQFPNAAIVMEDIRITQVQRVYVISTKLVCRRNTGGNLKLHLTLKRCSNKDSPDTCEDYQKINIKNMCVVANSKQQPWTPFVDEMKPRMSCPVTKGEYYVTNGTFDGDAFSALPIDGWYWKVEAIVMDVEVNKTVLCVYVEGQITTI